MTQCTVHAYVLMTNHVHLLLTPKTNQSAANLMKRLGQRYVQYVNRTYKRSGTLWEGRFRSSVIQQEEYLFTCQCYIEMNPVRANMVNQPEKYKWSSYKCNAHGEASKVITPHLLYKNLGKNKKQRQSTYRELFQYELDPGDIEKIRKSTNGNFVLGNARFADKISKTLNRRVTPGITGRPKQKTVEHKKS
ncbi:MAG: transposase [Desulfotalea sp.]